MCILATLETTGPKHRIVPSRDLALVVDSIHSRTFRSTAYFVYTFHQEFSLFFSCSLFVFLSRQVSG